MDKKWTLEVGANIKPDLAPKVNIKDEIDNNQKLELEISKDKVYASYELKF